MIQRHRIGRALRLALPAVLLGAGPALAGPPWVSIEYPANPFDPATRGALLVVHTYHHRAAMPFPVAATAEGRIGGERRSISLTVERTSTPGVWAVKGSLPADGSWVVSATMTYGEAGDRATALVGIARDGRLAAVRVPTDTRDGWPVPRVATRAETEAVLETALAASSVPARRVSEAPGRSLALAGLGAVLLVPVLRLGRRRPGRGEER
ncbi:MAG TPA: hypothetical protein VFQ38_23310 [Longimicrobiales bacterium]|nr:hypothetical protein [Longimicrobiales bacterium]